MNKRKTPKAPRSSVSQKRPETRSRPKLSLGKKLVFSVVAATLGLIVLELGLALLGVKPALYDHDPYVGFSSYLPLFVPIV